MWDFIVVGAGSSGCVLANRLSENPKHSVLLIEAGEPSRNIFIPMPRAFPRVLATPSLLWRYETTRKLGGASEVWVRGKALGGSSAVNGMMYVRGMPSDYDTWAEQGCTGWGWKDMQPCFDAIEVESGGPMRRSSAPRGQPLCEAVIQAATAMGIPEMKDLRRDTEGMGLAEWNIADGRRLTAAEAFLEPARRRPNLTVETGATVRRIIFEGRRAVGLVVRTSRGEQEFRAREIIMCAGALNTPHLLMCSGIGPAEHLRSLNIPVVADSPGMGKNLREHLLLHLQFRTTSGSENAEFRGAKLLWNVARYMLTHAGPISLGAMTVNGLVRTRTGLNRPDAQIMMSPVSLDRTVAGYAAEKLPGFICGGYVVRPEAQGSITLRSSDPAVGPVIDPNYLGDPRDQQAAIGIVHFVRTLVKQGPLAKLVVDEVWPGEQFSSDEKILEAFHTFGRCGYHTVGTCRMGSDATSVVDTQLRVRGVDGLRIGDISVMPALMSGNTNAPAMAMAWRLSQLILENRAA